MQTYDNVQMASIQRSAAYLSKKERIATNSKDGVQDILITAVWIGAVIAFGCLAAAMM